MLRRQTGVVRADGKPCFRSLKVDQKYMKSGFKGVPCQPKPGEAPVWWIEKLEQTDESAKA